MHWECRERFPATDFKGNRWLAIWYASRHMRHARAVMHVGIANPRWRGKRSRHSLRMCNPLLYISGKRPMVYFLSYNKNTCAWVHWHGSSRGQLTLCNPWGLTAEVLCSTDRVKVSVKEPIQFYYPTLKKQIQPLNHINTELLKQQISNFQTDFSYWSLLYIL